MPRPDFVQLILDGASLPTVRELYIDQLRLEHAEQTERDARLLAKWALVPAPEDVPGDEGEQE